MGNGTFNTNKDAMQQRLPLYFDPKDGVTGRDSLATHASEGLPNGLTWVRLDSVGEPTACVNLVVNPVTPGIPVTTAINRKNGQREITGVDATAYHQFSADLLRRAGVAVPLLFDSDSSLIGKVEPSSERGGLWIFVREFIHDGGSFLSGERQYYELGAEVAGISASMQVMVIVGVDTTDNTIDVTVDSSERGLAYVYSVEDANAITVPTDVIPLAALVLRDGQTLAADCFGKLPPRYFDQRQFLNLPGGTIDAADVAYTPTSPLTATDVQGALDEVAALIGGGGLTYILIREEQTSGTQGGTFTSGAWQTRVLNTEVVDTGGNASLASNQITLDAGTYRFRIRCPAFLVANHKAKLYNITDAADVEFGTSEFTAANAGSGVQTVSEIIGRMTIAGSKVFEVQHQCITTRATNGFGTATTLGTEIFTVCEFFKEA